jgi:hypothetical protein
MVDMVSYSPSWFWVRFLGEKGDLYRFLGQGKEVCGESLFAPGNYALGFMIVF